MARHARSGTPCLPGTEPSAHRHNGLASGVAPDLEDRDGRSIGVHLQSRSNGGKMAQNVMAKLVGEEGQSSLESASRIEHDAVGGPVAAHTVTAISQRQAHADL